MLYVRNEESESAGSHTLPQRKLTTEVRALLNDGSHVDPLVPPCRLGDSLVSTCVTSNRAHHSQVVLRDDLLHFLNTSEVSKHVAGEKGVFWGGGKKRGMGGQRYNEKRVSLEAEEEISDQVEGKTHPTETMFPASTNAWVTS